MNTIEIVESTLINPDSEAILNYERLDLDALLDDCMGQKDLLMELMRRYRNDVLTFIGITRSALTVQDYTVLLSATRDIMNGLTMMQTSSLRGIVILLHNISRTNGDLKYFEFLFQCFIEEFESVQKDMDMKLKQLLVLKR